MSIKHTIILATLTILSACGSQSVPNSTGRTEQVPVATEQAVQTVQPTGNANVAPVSATVTTAAVTPTPLPTATPSADPVPTPSETPTPIASATPSPVVTAVVAPTPAPTFVPTPGPTAQPTVVYPTLTPVSAPSPVATPVVTAPMPMHRPYNYSTVGVTWVLGNCSPLHASLMQFELETGGVWKVVGAPNDDVLIEADDAHNAVMGEIILVLPYQDTTISITCDTNGQCNGVWTLQGTPICNSPTIAPGN